jgi:hypothetical protein
MFIPDENFVRGKILSGLLEAFQSGPTPPSTAQTTDHMRRSSFIGTPVSRKPNGYCVPRSIR